MERMVDTPYGPMPGCPDCGIIKLHGDPHLCEHGVTPAPEAEVALAWVMSRDLVQAFCVGDED